MIKLLTLLLVLMCVSTATNAERVFEYGTGIVAVSIPTYPGSDDQSNYVLPLPYLYYKDEHLTIDREGLIGNLIESQRWELDASFSGGIPVNSDDSSAREGMPDVDWTLEAGPRLLYYLSGKDNEAGYLRVQIFVRNAFATDLSYLHSIGYRAGLGLEYERHTTLWNDKKLIWTNRLTANWANSDFLNYFYGVSQNYASENRPYYSNQSGYAGAELSSGITVKFDQVMLGVFARYQNFSGANAEESPLLQRTSSISAGIGLIYIFGGNKSD